MYLENYLNFVVFKANAESHGKGSDCRSEYQALI